MEFLEVGQELNKDNIYKVILELLIDNNINNNQFKNIIETILNDRNVKITIQHAIYTLPNAVECDLLIALFNERNIFNDKFVILCTEVYSRYLIRKNSADSRGLGLFDNGILLGYNVDSLFALPCIKGTNSDYLNVMLLYSTMLGYNNVLLYMIRRQVKITNHWKLLRIMIINNHNNIDLVLQNYDVNVRDNYGNTPIMVAKYLSNGSKITDCIKKYNPDLRIRNNLGATYYNLSRKNIVSHKSSITSDSFTRELKKYDLMVSNIQPNLRYRVLIKVITILLFLLYAYLVI